AYNGIKLCLSGARPVGEDTGLREIKRLASRDGWFGYQPDKGSVTRLDLLDDYAAHVRSFVDASVLRPLRVIADTANGMGGVVAPKVFEGLPFAFEVMYGELDGSFPHHPPDPIQVDNLKDLQGRVLETGADIGLAFDGDADRVFLVDEKAQPVSGATTTAMLAASILEKNPGSKVIANVIAYPAVRQIVVEHGGEPIRSRVGHS